MSETSLDLGSRLRMARHRQGKSLRDIAAVTKISTAWLEAIERNDFDRLPDGIFRRGYIRAFAAEVGADPEPLPDLLRQDPEAGAPAVVSAGGRSWRHHLPTAIAALLMVSSLMLLDTVDDGDSRTAEALVAPSSVATEPALSASSPDSDSRPGVTPPLATLELRFTGPSWVSASADGERVVHRLVKAGERLDITARDVITLEVGDAGAVESSINGAPLRALGEPGLVRRMEVTPPGPRVPAGKNT